MSSVAVSSANQNGPVFNASDYFKMIFDYQPKDINRPNGQDMDSYEHNGKVKISEEYGLTIDLRIFPL